MFFHLKVYLLCFKPTKKTSWCSCRFEVCHPENPPLNIADNFFFTQWQATRAVGTTHVILYRVDNLSTRSPQALTSTCFQFCKSCLSLTEEKSETMHVHKCIVKQNWRFHHLRSIVPQSCCSSLILSALVSKWKVLEINNPMKSQWCLYITAMGCAKKYNTGLPRSPYSCWYL